MFKFYKKELASLNLEMVLIIAIFIIVAIGGLAFLSGNISNIYNDAGELIGQENEVIANSNQIVDFMPIIDEPLNPEDSITLVGYCWVKYPDADSYRIQLIGTTTKNIYLDKILLETDGSFDATSQIITFDSPQFITPEIDNLWEELQTAKIIALKNGEPISDWTESTVEIEFPTP